MYALIMNGRKQIAKEFQHWVCSEVLPTIRKTGSFSLKRKRDNDLPDRCLTIRERTTNCIEKEIQLMQMLGPLTQSDAVFFRSQVMGLAPAIAAVPDGTVATPSTPGVAPSMAGEQLGLSQWLTRKGLGKHSRNCGLLSKIGKVMMAAYRKKYGAKAKPEMRSQQFAGGGFHDVNVYSKPKTFQPPKAVMTPHTPTLFSQSRHHPPHDF